MKLSTNEAEMVATESTRLVDRNKLEMMASVVDNSQILHMRLERYNFDRIFDDTIHLQSVILSNSEVGLPGHVVTIP
jgi:hypothetical protein